MKNWQKTTNNKEQIKRGSPSLIWTSGLEKRLSLIEKFIDFNGKKFLDVGCGTGIFLKKIKEKGAEVYGIDIDKKKIEIAKKINKNVKVAKSEAIPFNKNFFDIILLHEVIEHVDNDVKTIDECFRVLKSRGYIVIFAPNKLFPFETHGVYLNGKYKFGNIPLVPYLPNKIYKKMTPHVRNYSKKQLLTLFRFKSFKIIHYSRVFPSFDNSFKNFQVISKVLKHFANLAEKTPLNIFGISHFLIIKKL